MICMSETWMELASSSTGRSRTARARRARLALRTMRVSLPAFVEVAEVVAL